MFGNSGPDLLKWIGVHPISTIRYGYVRQSISRPSQIDKNLFGFGSSMWVFSVSAPTEERVQARVVQRTEAPTEQQSVAFADRRTNTPADQRAATLVEQQTPAE